MNTDNSASGSIFQSGDYKRSRTAYILRCAFEYLVSLFLADAFLAKLLSSLGLSDALIGIIASFVSFSYLFQLLSLFLMEHISNIKRTAIVFSVIGQLLFTSLYVLPFLPIPPSFRSAAVILFFLVAYFCKYLISSMCFKWAYPFVDPAKRAVFSAKNEIVSLACGIVLTIGAGLMMDRFEQAGNLRGCFFCIAVLMLVFSICDFICLLLIRNATPEETAQMRKPFGDALRYVLGNRSFWCVVLMTSMWSAAIYLTVSFLGTYKTNDLLITVGTVQLINVGANVCRIAVSGPFGRFSDRRSYAAGYKLALLIAACAFAVNMFTTPQRWWLIIAFMVLYYCSLAGTGQNGTNILYYFVDSNYIVQAVAIKNAIVGVASFCASLIGSRILSAVQANGNVVFGVPLYGQQLLSALSFLLTLATAAYTCFRVEKLPHRGV